jgi:hypothetical protein
MSTKVDDSDYIKIGSKEKINTSCDPSKFHRFDLCDEYKCSNLDNCKPYQDYISYNKSFEKITEDYQNHLQIKSENNDNVNNPFHYNVGIETIKYIESWNMNYIEGNIIKYVTRYKYKNGLEDLKKCSWYLKRLIEITEKENKTE